MLRLGENQMMMMYLVSFDLLLMRRTLVMFAFERVSRYFAEYRGKESDGTEDP